MRRKGDNHNISLRDFLVRCLLWGTLGYADGARGTKLAGVAFLGPVSEQVFDFSLEDVAEAIERKRQQKELQEKLYQKLGQVIKAPALPAVKQDNSPIDKLLLPSGAFDLKPDSLLLKPPEAYKPDIRWLDLLIHPSIILLLGGRGSGKTALGFRCLEIFDALTGHR